MKSVSNLRPGCIVILNVDEVAGSNIPEFIVVGSEPTVTRPANQVTFNPVLKKNGRDEYFVSSRTKTLNFDLDNILDVYAVLQPGMTHRDILTIQDDFGADLGEVTAAFNNAALKREWYINEFHDGHLEYEITRSANNVPDTDEELSRDADEEETVNTEVAPDETTTANLRRFYVVIDSNDDAAECLECALEELIGDGDINEFSVTELE